MNKREEILGNEKISTVLMKLSIPATVAMFVNALYNIVDTIFIGKGIGKLGIAGVAIQLPIQMIILSCALLIGIGSGSLISRSLGEKNSEKVNYVAGNSFLCVLIIGILFSTLGYYFAEPILVLFGSTKNIMPYAKEYTKIMFIGSLYFPFCVSTNNIIRAEGNSKDAMISMIIGFLLNIILDYIFIFVINMGIKGAAIATILSKLGSFVYLMFYLRSHKTSIKIKLKYFYPKKDILKEILAIGFSGFAVQISGSIVAIILNHRLGHFGGALDIAIYGIVYKVTLFLFMPLNGMIQGMQPIVGYNYGAKNIHRVKEAIMLTMKVTTIIVTVGVFIGEVFPRTIMSLFSNDLELIQLGGDVLRIVIMMTPLLGIQMTGLGLAQSLGKAMTSFILSILRQVLLFIPIVFILPNLHSLEIWGVWIAFPISDLLSVLITMIILKIQMNKILVNIDNK